MVRNAHVMSYTIESLYTVGAISGNGYYTFNLPVHILDLNCTGNESSLWDCPYNGTADFFNCPSSHDAEVICRSMLLF